MRYTGNGGIYPTYLCNRLRREGLDKKDCMGFRCDVLDPVITEEVRPCNQQNWGLPWVLYENWKHVIRR